MVDIYEVIAVGSHRAIYAYPAGVSFPLEGEVLGVYPAHAVSSDLIKAGGDVLKADIAIKMSAKRSEWEAQAKAIRIKEQEATDAERAQREKKPEPVKEDWSKQVEAETVVKPQAPKKPKARK